jgi:hypothetical protein
VACEVGLRDASQSTARADQAKVPQRRRRWTLPLLTLTSNVERSNVSTPLPLIQTLSPSAASHQQTLQPRGECMRPIVVSSLLFVSVAAASWSGGWAIITVEDVPSHVVAGDTVSLSFMVRQHGMHPMTDLQPQVKVRIGDDEATIQARNGGRAGQYRSAFVVRKTGEAAITIRTGFNNANVDLIPVSAIAAHAKAPVVPEREAGRRLYVAKGCVSCHTHADVRPTNEVGGAVELTERRYTASYLARLLENPAAVIKSNSTFWMPSLELKPHEIAALTAFLNAER